MLGYPWKAKEQAGVSHIPAPPISLLLEDRGYNGDVVFVPDPNADIFTFILKRGEYHTQTHSQLGFRDPKAIGGDNRITCFWATVVLKK